ncbi:hypothetical protein [Micromonospora parathelypteridis]|uniref:Uncharacterized protein n=1 Tax=Micromonospora parathelypteridis TaxID=1839617 RepID=A0A840VT36_9ACTN|nr:hypothetical protein [Micromonospora parathelypteridis]MBB5476178.1 hypothetical protein [Micromonospora parathelypteridis]GGO13804.1 hypothetical protein GCM10011576_24180 [Micromonospora parathelypteridis]
MESDEPPDDAMEAATADLLHLGFLEIRSLTVPPPEAEPATALTRRRERASMIADICHQLPGLLAPQRRHQLADGLRYQWRTASATKREWLRSRWDHLNYDHRWLTEAAITERTTTGKHDRIDRPPV